MKILKFLLFALLLPTVALGQVPEESAEREFFPDTVPFVIDSIYREDQFYIGLTFNLITSTPASISQSGFSGGFHGGFMRDFPLNKRRNIGFAAGLGWSINTYGHNLFIGEDTSGETIFRSLGNEISYDTNRFSTQLIEAPIEFRWRTSTVNTYQFWRIYTGLKLGYIYYFRSNFVQPGNAVRQTQLSELERFRLGASFTFGYNTFNFQFYYSLNPLFNDARVNGETLGIHPLRIGLMFYIL